jgi:hypothetical protein
MQQRLRLGNYLQPPSLLQECDRFFRLVQVLGSIGVLFETVMIAPANPIPKAEEAGLLVVNDLRVECAEAVVILLNELDESQ